MANTFSEVVIWTPISSPPTEPGKFYLVRFKSGGIDQAPFTGCARKFQHGRDKEITHWAEQLKGPVNEYGCQCTPGNYADDCPKHGSGLPIVGGLYFPPTIKPSI